MGSFFTRTLLQGLFTAFIVLIMQCAKHVPIGPDDELIPGKLSFTNPLPDNDTVMIDDIYSCVIGGYSDNEEDSVYLFFSGVTPGYSYIPSNGKFFWKADKNVVNSESGPIIVTAGLTNMYDTLYYTWTLYLKKHSWEYMGTYENMVGFAAYDLNLVFKLCEEKDSVVNGIGFHSGFINRSYDGGQAFESDRLISVVLKRFFKDDMYSFQGLRNLRVYNNKVFYVFHVLTGNTGPAKYEAWNLLSVDTNVGALSNPKFYCANHANESFDYFMAPGSQKVYQLSSSVSGNLIFASAKIMYDTIKEIEISQTTANCISGTNTSENVFASFYFFGVYRKIGADGLWENIFKNSFRKIDVASENGDTLYCVGMDSSFHVITNAVKSKTVTPQKIPVPDKIAEVKMLNGHTGWILTANNEVYFTNDMFSSLVKADIMKEGSIVKVTSLIRAFKDRHVFALSENKEVFRY